MVDAARLALRPLTAADLPWLQGFNALPEVRKYLFDDEVWTEDEVRERLIVTNDELWRVEGVGLFTIARHDDPAPLGWCGFWYFHEPPIREVCYALHPAYWGRGYAREALAALMRWASDTQAHASFVASVDEPNERSHHLLARLGFIETHRSAGRQHPLRHYRREGSPPAG